MQRKTLEECQAEFQALKLEGQIVAANNLEQWLAERGWTEKELIAAAEAICLAAKANNA